MPGELGRGHILLNPGNTKQSVRELLLLCCTVWLWTP